MNSAERFRRTQYLSIAIERVAQLERKLRGAVLTTDEVTSATADEVAAGLEKVAADLRARTF